MTWRNGLFPRTILVSAAVLFSVVGTASAGVVTFGTLPGPNGTPFATVTEDGITVASTAGAWQQGFNVGNPIPSIFTFDGTASVTVTTGGLFDFTSFDLGTGGCCGPAFSVQEFVGATLVDSFSGTNADDLFHTISDTFVGLVDRVVITTTITGLTTSANLDNIAVAAAPEPATLALLGVGLAGIAFGRRRKH